MSLNDFITDLARDEASSPGKSGFFSLVNALEHASGDCFNLLDGTVTQDSLLQTLLRDYAQNQSRLNAIISEHGAGSPMAELATEMRDMARVSVETRLLELRQSHPDFFKKDLKTQALDSERSLETYPRLSKRKEKEDKLKREKDKAEREANADIANDTFLAFILLSLFSSRFQKSGQLVPFIDMRGSFQGATDRKNTDI